MLRNARLPLILWLPAALLLHMFGGGGAIVAANMAQHRADILAFSRAVGRNIASDPPVIEIEVYEEPEAAALPQDPPSQALPIEDEAHGDVSTEADVARHEPLPKPKPAPVPRKTKVAPETPKPEPAKVAKPSPKAIPKPGAKPIVAPPLSPDGRLAVINDPDTKKNQPDNPDAARIADDANHTERERMAKIRSYDQNSRKPQPAGGPKQHAADEPGDSPQDAPGFSTDMPEEDDREARRAGSTDGPETPAARRAKRALETPKTPGRDARKASASRKAMPAGQGARTSKVANGAAKDWRIDPSGGDGRPKREARRAKRGRRGRVAVPGKRGAALPKRFRVDAHGVREALGADYLKRDQERARNTRIAKHRGRFAAANFKRFRAAIENYDPSVKPGNQTSLNAARVPFASYINRMHNRIHPIFADGFLRSIDDLGPGHALANMKLVTHLELVLDREAGKLLKFGVVKPSGVTAFEVAALRSIEQAGPFGKPPKSIVSTDGKVYIHWEFFRNPYYACTSRFARPFLIQHPPDLPSGPRKGLPAPSKPPTADERQGGFTPHESPRTSTQAHHKHVHLRRPPNMRHSANFR